jgi:NAD(P)-dependent dehydrogenase (short-subunit alcohol dehydrogenase family)
VADPRTYLVTGAAGGIGYACARQLLNERHRVAALDVQAIPSSLSHGIEGAALLSLRADVSSEAECAMAVADTVARFGGLDGLIHMAALHSTLTWEEADAAEFNRILAVNVTGAFLIAKAAAGPMKKAKRGAIVFASSTVMNSGGVGGHGRGGPAYATSKAAIVGLTRSLAKSLAPHGIRVNAVSPGSTDTPMTADYSEAALALLAERVPLGRIGRADEIAAVACFLAGDGASYIVGDVVNANGGGSFS